MTRQSEEAVAVVTGAAQGLGEAIAARFVQDGFNVVYADVNDDLNQQAARAVDPSGEVVLPLHMDVRELESVEGGLSAAVSHWGRVDVWVNNAARTTARPFLDIDPLEWDDVLATNLRGTYFGCRVAGRHMCERGFGRIINLASLAGQWGRSPTGAHYAASKAGILALTRYAATAFASYGVTVNAIAPTAIEGPAVAAMPPEQIAAYVREIPVGRLGQPHEAAALAAFLASDAAGFITGATYDINGGILMR
jgi:3-oxoacyl-[acyl-carrier protein] reductase